MKRTLRKIVSLVLMLAISANVIFPASAATATSDYDTLIQEVGRTFDLFKALGLDYDTLTKVVDEGVRDEDFWGTPAASYVMTEDDLQTLYDADLVMVDENTIQEVMADPVNTDSLPDVEPPPMPHDGDAYDGNPPYTVEEQKDRMMYLWGVYNKYYSAPKYNPNPYLVYLYISHYTENINYDRTAATPNFDSIYAHIICENDIVVYNNFLNISQYARVLARVANFGSALDFLGGIEGGVNLYTREITEANDVLEAQIDAVNGALALIPGDEALKEEKLKEVARAFGNKYKDAESAAMLVADLNAQLNESGGLGDLINVYADSVQGIFTNAAFMTIGSGVMGGIFGAAELMKTFTSIGNLAGLYYNWSTRYAERMGIDLGLFPWP